MTQYHRSQRCKSVLRAAFAISALLMTASLPVTAAKAAPKPADIASDKAAAIAAKTDQLPLIAVVSIADQHVTIWSGDTRIARSSVSTGMDGHRTPHGVFSVIGKEKYHESNIYSGAPMPFMQRITWSGIALHAGHIPGYAASHGCIRLPESFAERLYGMTRVGMRVIVSPHDLSPASFTHPTLPNPTFIREAQLTGTLPQVASYSMVQTGSLANRPESASGFAPASIPASIKAPMQLGGPAVDDENRLLNPMERAKIEQVTAKIAALEAKADAQALLDISTIRSAEAQAALDTAREADVAVNVIQRGLEKARQITADMTGNADQLARVLVDRSKLEAALGVAIQRSADAQMEAKVADAAAFHAASEAKTAMAERDDLEQAARIAEHATAPVSIFVSRKERRVFVRQGFEPMFDAEIDIRDAAEPIGTHVFTAFAPPAEGGSMRWVTMTMPGSSRDDSGTNSRAGKPSTREARPVNPLPQTAANALTRVKFSDDVMQKISQKLWTGASLIISDHGISPETGKGTDFVILTR